jgi:ATP-dependent exoDNAse (exonuclease V) beta subunit
VVAPASFFGDPESTADQRKLLYVALTRAKRLASIIKLN